MALQLDHTIVPAYDKVKSAKLMARLFGLEYHGTWGHFAPVKVNDILTLDFDNSDDPRSNHYAFLASDEEFDAVLQRGEGRGHVVRQRPPALGPTAKSITRTKAAVSTSSAKTATCGKSSRTRMLRIESIAMIETL